MTLYATQTIQRRTSGWLMNNELERMSNKALDGVIWNLYAMQEGNEENHEITPLE
jgi:hypothetical protein